MVLRLLVGVAVLGVVLLAAVGHELRGLNQRLDRFAADNYGWPRVTATDTPDRTPETREQRDERIRREVRELADDWRAAITAATPARGASPRPTKPPSPQLRDRSEPTTDAKPR